MKMYSIQIKVFIILCIMKISKQASICFNIRDTLQAKYVRYSAVNRNIFGLFQKHIFFKKKKKKKKKKKRSEEIIFNVTVSVYHVAIEWFPAPCSL